MNSSTEILFVLNSFARSSKGRIGRSERFDDGSNPSLATLGTNIAYVPRVFKLFNFGRASQLAVAAVLKTVRSKVS